MVLSRILEHFDLRKDGTSQLKQYYDDMVELPRNGARFPDAYLARHKASGEIRSIAIFPKKSFPEDFFWKEVEIFKKILHPNVLCLYETLEDRKCYYYVTDRKDFPNIYQAIPQLFPKVQDFDEKEAASLVRTILKTLQYCHKLDMPHTDLTYEYILVDPEKGAEKGFDAITMVGFGQARLAREYTYYKNECNKGAPMVDDSVDGTEMMDDTSRMNDNDGPPKRMARKDIFAAPETRWGEFSIYEASSDIWSLGVITYQLLARRHPFEDPNIRPKSFEDEEWKEDHFETSPWLEHLSPEAKDFIKQLMNYKHVDRPTATEALEHPWMRILKYQRRNNEQLMDCLSNLQSFDARNKLEQSARSYIVGNLLNQKERKVLDKYFSTLDFEKDKANVITKEELEHAFEKIHGQDKSEKVQEMLVKIFDQVDVNKDGRIEYSEFLAAAADEDVLLTRKNLRSTFNAFDKSRTGTITLDDLKQILSEGGKMNTREAKKIMREADTDGDGEISYEEFLDLMHR